MIAGATSKGYCDLSLVAQVDSLMTLLLQLDITSFIFAGHSLGGTAAFCLAGKYTHARAICFNMGAAPSNPIYNGPGGRATVYHIVGDIISSHISSQAAMVIRVAIQGIAFGSLASHSASTIFNTQPWKIVSAQEEDDLFQLWLKKFKIVPAATRFIAYLNFVKRDAAKEGIPESDRAINKV